ncbi:hypothetical protein [Streptomyces cinerochromogenes]|uniref:hypothetical protein n=1 Tax=Streptomyces cinerochromogenes TaxID=66422 RepID=UPI0016706410|nr:hypothetical protein [Streptomyces cinerochromogenes]GGS93641.1 hypothetical protein GCM10010206_65480 [Streptomyces cinerochromogenes]
MTKASRAAGTPSRARPGGCGAVFRRAAINVTGSPDGIHRTRRTQCRALPRHAAEAVIEETDRRGPRSAGLTARFGGPDDGSVWRLGLAARPDGPDDGQV